MKVKRQASIREMRDAMAALDLESIPPQKRPVAVMAQFLKVSTRHLSDEERGKIFAGFARKVAEANHMAEYNGAPNYSDLIRAIPVSDGPKTEQEAEFLRTISKK